MSTTAADLLADKQHAIYRYHPLRPLASNGITRQASRWCFACHR